ncbi:MAG: prepilin-type N-terminal cleavage/methylation domain-containing protein [bacterium]
MSKVLKNKGFTLIEVIIYCAIFLSFAIISIESMIWLNSRLSLQANAAEDIDESVYKIYFNNIYYRYKINNQKINALFPELTASTSQIYPLIKEDSNLGIILNQLSLLKEKNDSKITLFDSIGL